jgi:hypothetical protein
VGSRQPRCPRPRRRTRQADTLSTDEGGDDDDDDQTYIITATEEKIADAVTRVNDYLAELPQGAATAAATGFQRALSIPPRGPEGGGHESLTDDDDDEDD